MEASSSLAAKCKSVITARVSPTRRARSCASSAARPRRRRTTRLSPLPSVTEPTTDYDQGCPHWCRYRWPRGQAGRQQGLCDWSVQVPADPDDGAWSMYTDAPPRHVHVLQECTPVLPQWLLGIRHVHRAELLRGVPALPAVEHGLLLPDYHICVFDQDVISEVPARARALPGWISICIHWPQAILELEATWSAAICFLIPRDSWPGRSCGHPTVVNQEAATRTCGPSAPWFTCR